MSPTGFKLLVSACKTVESLSQPLLTQLRPRSHAHPPAPSFLLAIPFDIIEEILLYLRGQDIIRMKQVR